MSVTMDDSIKRWTAKRKTGLVIEIIQGKTTVAEASRSFDLSPSEIEGWVEDAKRGMENSLRARRCCTTLTVEDSQRESMRLDGLHEQAIPRPLPHDKLVQLHCLALQARFAVDLAGQGHDLALAA